MIEELGRVFFPEQENNLLTVQERQVFLEKFSDGNASVARNLGITAEDDLLFSRQDMVNCGEPRKLSDQDLCKMLLALNLAWVRGVGSVPFQAYNLQKLRYLRLRLMSVSGPRRQLLRIQMLFHTALRWLWRLLPIRWSEAEAEEYIIRYLVKSMRLQRQAGHNWLPRSDD